MKKLFPVFLVILCSNVVFAQQTGATDPRPEFLRFPTVPPFNLLKVDSATYLTKDDIKKHHLTMIMYFSPECDHCKHQTRDILEQSDKFKDIEIVMATYQPF